MTHRARIERCIHCGGPTVHRRQVPPEGWASTTEYDWCARCATAMWCACEGCEIMRALMGPS